MIFVDLVSAETSLHVAIENDERADFERLTQYLAPWDQERRTLAAGITPREFHLIAVAFRNLEEYVVDPTGIDAVLETVTRAREIAWRASGMKNGTHGTDMAPDWLEGGPPSA